jgi:thiazole/oxazole-forming peptide maturase SagD family component
MSRTGLSRRWHDDPFTGLFAESGPVPPRPHDPDVRVWSGALRLPGDAGTLTAGGAGWDDDAAEAAGVGEAVERLCPWPLPRDAAIEASVATWPLDEPPVDPGRWVLFHPEQYAVAGFPFRPLRRDTVCRWVCFREAGRGNPWWVPEEIAFLSTRPGVCNVLTPGLSTGLSCGRVGDPVLLRGLQEVIERDALVGAWWDRYPLEEHAAADVWPLLPGSVRFRLERPNLRYRFYRVATPFAGNVTLVTVEGEDEEGCCFAAGSACRETRAASWSKSLLEAVQGRHYVRRLKGEFLAEPRSLDVPASFADHALFYSVYPERLASTVLGRPIQPTRDERSEEGFAELTDRLGAERPVLFRLLTPPGVAAERLGWYVVRVLVPGMQPLHGHHALPFLGGRLWSPRGLREWVEVPPHPFA